MTEAKKKRIRKIIKEYAGLLELENYHILSKFKTAAEDSELKNAFAIVAIDDQKKTIYIRLNSYEFNKMGIREIRRYILHELLHSFFSELSDFFDQVLKRANFSKAKAKVLRNKFDSLEHKKIYHLIRVMY